MDGAKLIGQGRLAKIYLYDGFAYKVFENSYPAQAVDYELRVQREIVKTGLPAVHYYKTDTPGVIRMDYIEGMTLSDKIWRQKYTGGVEVLFSLQKQIHRAENAELPRISAVLPEAVKNADASEAEKNTALNYLSEIADENRLCHLDLHFLNIMCAAGEEKYTVIDWVSAMIGNPIFDFARTYAIMYEFAEMFADEYLRLLKADGVDSEAFRKAVYIIALHRIPETNGIKMRELMLNLPVLASIK